MRKLFKILGKLVKWYAYLTVGLWTWVGLSNGLDQARKHPELNALEVDELVIEKTNKKYKKWFNAVRG